MVFLGHFDLADYKAVLSATVQVQRAMEMDPKIGHFVNVGPQTMFVGKFYAQWSSSPSAFEGFSHLTPIQTLVPPMNGTLKSLVTAINTHMGEAKWVHYDPQPSKLRTETPVRREPQSLSHGIDLELYIKIHEQHIAFLNASQTSTATLTYTLQPVGKSCVQSGRQRGGNSLGTGVA
jgi:hypothetical protein